MKQVKVVTFTTLMVLTLTVVTFDLRFFTPPRVLYIQVFGHGEKYSESWTVVDITNHPLKEGIMLYMNKSMRLGERIDTRMGVGERIYIFQNPELVEFFAKYYVSSWCLTCALEMSPHLKDGAIYYHVLVGYSNVCLSPLEYAVAWTVSIATAILWVFAVSYIYRLKTEKEESSLQKTVGNVSHSFAVFRLSCDY